MGTRFLGRWWGNLPSSSLNSVCLALDTTDWPVFIDWRSHSLLCIGESGSGKSNTIANLLCEVEPFVQQGLVELYGIDLKAMEFSMSKNVFHAVATDAESALALTDTLREDMLKRARELAGTAREHVPSVSSPRRVIIVDELAELFRQDSKISKHFQQNLTSLLSMGRATGNIVWGFSQNPRKESLPVRDDFNGQMIALRMGETEAKLMLPSAALRAGAAPWAISASSPGAGWFWNSDTKKAQLFRTDWISDDELRALTAVSDA
ncbi:FtsK/SpoIIIE domain-containing protein [Bifidobacterium sp. ESL0798]|uniref:FtsK/SpoIIIE domain-containing protein n=1 Tax=Bifidobacterium sp. ESL0798 TaxID=2983235 RepID=UPI0023F86718|nr:FtsK/SpoIIIE domain-containing protein [Bifidobacterium sp. ESL0798]WEV74032.1 FtsK/SpoIIIE domain-containing protein [Bifidobacterium sp. ESL0798]